MMHRRPVFLWFFLQILVCLPAHAISARAVEIFNRQNRTLQAPPRSLTADESSLDTRVEVEQRRLATQSEASDSIEVSAPAVDSRAEKVSKRSQLREEARDTRAASLSFQGERVFGVGLVGGGAYGVFGTEFDFSVDDKLSVGFGIGTGMTYSTWGVQTRYFLRQARFNTYLQLGYANWYLSRTSESGEKVLPQYMAKRFFENDAGVIEAGQRLHLFYPGIGVLVQHPSGLATAAMLQYMISLSDFAGGLYGSLGLYFFF